MTSPALWLVLRELAARRGRIALAGAAIAAIAAAVTATELVARSREDAVAAQIDAMGSALAVVPRGVSAGALARYELGDRVLPDGVEAAVRAALGRDLRAVERRAVAHREIAGARVPVFGVEDDAFTAARDRAGSVAVGAELARRLGGVSTIALDGREYAVAAVLPSTASPEDLGVFVPLQSVHLLPGAAGVNELRLFLRAGVSPREAEARLARAGLEATVVRSDRGEVADRGVQDSLARHRGVAYAVMAAVAALCLLVAAHLDAAERRTEVATLVAIGASRWTVLGAALSRSALVAATGAALGVIGGAALAAGQVPVTLATLARCGSVAASIVGSALAVGIVAATPTAVVSAVRDPVRELQEG